MGFIGGDFTEITYNHPTLGSGILSPKSAEDSTVNKGGRRGNDDANAITAKGQSIRQINNTRWSCEMNVAWDTGDQDTLDLMGALAGDPVEADWTFTHIGGSVYVGKGSPVGDIEGNGNTATFTLKIAGSGILEKI